MSATGGAGTVYQNGVPEFILVFSGVRVTRSLVLCVMFCRLLFVIFLLAIVAALLRFVASEYPFGIFGIF